ncbi:Chaperone protein DnaJ OS=Geobacillus kaustophilus (strain HTA426) GN=dnaJ PE=3 SV=1 [Rhizoctonia solani AG-1 IB]|uniref:Chaperone protein DnaJ n=1 Tax=Thanatephorus cucumeris (strain AG1-IB / isolate 7/3/14) TaxID=1108050 RepID=A0A0B7FRG1_THACB|nr:Chaperone protein DnaJ OS=Geobacillus kaustophilus (strain HTA426) GN=dnaJ PE=3 SV=1 [Rhizoctonia solani AG-1 IB]
MSLAALIARSSRPTTAVFSGINNNKIHWIIGRSPADNFRYFSQTCIFRTTHYETLGVPQNATKGQIKASFYNLSKRYHPDVSPDTKEKFVAASEAYGVLHDDRARRAYDRTLVGSSAHDNPSGSPSWTHDNLHRRPRATHAWESPRRHRAHQNGGHQHPQAHARTSTGGYTHASPHARRATGGGGYSHIPRQDPNSPLSKLERESAVWRVVTVFGLLNEIWSVVTASFISAIFIDAIHQDNN